MDVKLRLKMGIRQDIFQTGLWAGALVYGLFEAWWYSSNLGT